MGLPRLRRVDENRKETEFRAEEDEEGFVAGRRRREGQCVVIAEMAIIPRENKFYFFEIDFAYK